jgi:hypothetical protein
MAASSPSTPATSSSASIDAGIDNMIHKAEESIARCVHDCEDFVRQSPTKAVLGALAAGYLLRHLPLRSILIAKVRLITALAPPALVLYGAAKVYEYLQEQGALPLPQGGDDGQNQAQGSQGGDQERSHSGRKRMQTQQAQA